MSEEVERIVRVMHEAQNKYFNEHASDAEMRMKYTGPFETLPPLQQALYRAAAAAVIAELTGPVIVIRG